MTKEINELLNKQRAYYASGITKDPDFRLYQLKKLSSAMDTYEKDILHALQADLHKPCLEGYTSELGFVNSEIDYMISKLHRFARPQKVRTPLAYLGAKSRIYSDPLGLVLIIGPWNYPFHLMIAPLVGAIAGGNCSILKPSEYAPHVSKVIKEMISAAYAEEYVAVVEGDENECSALLQERFDHIFFTGGATVGRIVMQAASRHLTPVTLELGGKSPCIVDSSCNIEQAARRICWGKFLNSGQTCVAPDYLLAEGKIKEELVKAIKNNIRGFYGDDPFNSPDYPRIINERHFNRLQAYLDDGVILCGGQSKQEDLYIAPTLLDQVSPDAPVMQEEIFGPILPVMEYQSLDEAIHFVNQRPKPLALYFFSRDKQKQEKVLRETSSGGVCINDTLSHITTQHLPFGGVGESGMGRYHGQASFDTFVHKKSVLKGSYLFDLNIKYPPYNTPVEKMKKLMKFM